MTGTDMEPTQVIHNAEYIFSERGVMQNKLSAGLMKQFDNDTNYVVIEEDLKLEIFNASEKKVAQLTSLRGLYLEKSGRMEALDSVVFSNVQGETLITEKLIWLQDSAIIYSEDPVTIYRDQGVIYGDGIVSNESFTKYSITKPRGELEVTNPPKENE